MPLPATILIFGHDSMLLDTRRWVLEQAGFNVISVSNPDRVARIVREESVDLLLLCHTLSPAERRVAVATSRAIQPDLRSLVMVTSTLEAGHEEIGGESLSLFAGAEGLITATRNVLNRNPRG